MITAIRNHLKQSTYRAIVMFLVFALAAGMISLPSMLRKGTEGQWAIKVNKEEISYQDYAREIAEQREYIAHIRAQFGQFADYLLQSMGWTADPKALAFDMLVKEELMMQFADKLGIYLHSDFIVKNINDAETAKKYLADIIPQFVFDNTGTLNMNALRTYLQRKGLTINAFDRKVERVLSRNHVMGIVESLTYVPNFDINQRFIAEKMGKSFSILTFSFDDYLALEKKKEVTDQELSAFYDSQNKQFRRYFVPEKRGGITWKFDPQVYDITVSDEEINEYYEDNKVKKYVAENMKVVVKQITQDQLPAEVSLEDVRNQLLKDQPSEWDKEWKLLDSFARGEKDKALEQAAFLLTKEGDISPVFKTKDGTAIVQLVKRIARSYKPLSTVKKEIKETLINKKFKQRFVNDMKDIAKHESGDAIKSFILQKGGKKEVVTDIAKDDSRISQELFSLKKDGYSFYIENNVGFAITLTDVKERNLPQLDSIAQIVKGDIYEERAKRSLHQAVQEAKNSVAHYSFDDLQDRFNASLDSTDTIKQDDQKKVSSLEKRGLPAREMLSMEKEGLIMVHEADRNSFLIKLDSIESFSQDQFNEARDAILSQLEPARKRLYIEGFVASLYRNATIETNELILISDEEYSE